MAQEKKIIKLSNTKLKPVKKKNNEEEKKQPHKTVRKRKKHFFKKFLNGLLIFLMFIGIVVMLAVLGFCGYIVMSAPDFNTDLLYKKESSILLDSNGNELVKLGSEQRIMKTYDELPQVLIDAIVSAEDSRFFQHNGFDVVRFTKASLGQLAGQAGAGGASTLTMQVVKNTFTSKEAHGIKGIIRKFTDIYMSVFKIEKNYTKEEIMEFYVNAPFMGMNSYGVEQACLTYFGKSVSDISLTEAAIIAGIFNAPSNYNPFNSIELTTQRRNTILDLMVRHGYITKEQAQDAKDIPVESLITTKASDDLHKYQSFIDSVPADVKEKTGYDLFSTPMIVTTTLNPSIQDVLNDLNNEKLGYKWVDDVIQIGMVVTDVKTGAVLAVNGGRNQTTRFAYNRATSSMRDKQPGSIIKPILDYGPYLEYNNGSTGSIFYDVPYTFSNGQKVTNSDNSYAGAITMRKALIDSRNIPAVQAFQAVDKNKITEFANACGINFCYNDDDPNDCPLYEAYAIGGGMEVNPLDMAAAYGTFARGGYYIEPYTFTKIELLETGEVIEYKPERTQAMSAETAYMINDMLVDATKNGVGGNIKISGTDVASKTGTSTFDAAALRAKGFPSSASADNWVITYSPDYVISFWYGYDKTETKHYTDSIRAAIQRKKISAVVANKIYKKNSKFTKPSNVVSARFEKETNPIELPSEYTPSNLIGTGLFKKGTEPTQVSTRFAQLNNPSNGNAIENNGVIELSWNGIKTPDAINQTYLQNYFKQGYGKQASTYLNRRLTYNQNSIGTVGYEVYLDTDSGLQRLGFTSDTNFDYTVTKNDTYTFVIKSSYSIFKANMSSGHNITITVSDLEEIPELPEEPSDGQTETNPDVSGVTP